MRRRRIISLKLRRRVTKNLRVFLLFCRTWKKQLPKALKSISIFSKKTWTKRFAISALIVTIIASSFTFFNHPNVVLGQTYSLTQNDWSGGAASDTPNAPANLSGWNKYASASGVTAGAGSVGLTLNQTVFSDSFNTSAFNDTANTTANWNTGTGRIEVPSATAYVASDNYWQLNGVLAGGDIRLLSDSANGAVYGVSNSGGFAKYDIASGVLTDLRVTSGLYAFWGQNDINALVFGPSNNSIYLFGGSGAFAVYNIATNTATDLRTSSGLSVFWGSNHGMSIVFDSTASKVYLGGINSNFAVYDIATNTATDLATTSGLSSFWSGGSQSVNTLAWDQINRKIYLSGGQDAANRCRFAVYDIDTNTATNLYVTSGLSAIFVQYQTQAIAINPINHLIYLVGGGNLSSESKFAVYDPNTNIATDLYVTSGLKAFFVYPQLYALAIDSSNGKVYMAGGYGSFAVYTPGTPGSTVNLAVTSGLSVFLNGSSGDDNNGATYSLAFDSISSKVFLGGFYHLTSYTIGNPGVATNLSDKVSPFGWNGKNIYASVYNPANHLIYLAGDGARLLSYNPASGAYVNLSATSGLPALMFGVNAMVLGPDNTKLYLVSYARLIVYDIASNVATSLSASSGLSGFMGSTNILSATVDVDSGKIYLGGSGNALAVYDIASNVATNLSVTSGLSGFWSSNDLLSLVFASVGRKLYLGGKNGQFAVYDPVSGVSTALHTTSGLSVFWGTEYVTAMAYDSNNAKIYLGGSNSRFAVYTPGSPGTSVDISTTSGLRTFGSSFYAMIMDPTNGKIFISGYGTLAVYQISNNTASSLTAVSGLSAFFSTSIYSLVLDSAGTNVYIAGLYGHLTKVSAPCSACVATSLTTDSTGQNIKSATLTKTDAVGTGTLSYRLSNDGGATYNIVTPGSLYTFLTVGSDLRIQVAITGNATVQDIAIAYNYYSADGSLTSSKFDSTDTTNVVNRLVWDEDASLPTGTSVTVSLRTADVSTNLTGSWTDLTNASANCGKVGTTVTCGASALPSGFQDGSGDRWFQYKISIVSDGRNTATISSLGVQFVVNAMPEVRNVTATQNSDGTVTIHYEVRDTDTSTGSPANRGHIIPSFEYWDGFAYQNISTLAPDDANQKTVAMDGGWNEVVYTATWTPSADFAGHFMNNTARIRVTASDGEGANSTGTAESPTYTLDTSAPTSDSITIDASTIPATVHLSSSDDNAVTMKVSSSDPTLSTTSSEPFAVTKTMSLSEGARVYAKFTDAFQNSTSILSALVPATPTAVMIQDTSNVISDPRLYRLFVAWKVVAGSFASYRVHRSGTLENPESWPEVASINSRAINYYLDTDVTENGHYYYYAETVDASGNVSFRSTIVDGVADGAQSGGEGGGGIGPAPIISNVSSGIPQATTATITWNTDALSDSTVSYSTSPSTFTTSVNIGSLVNNDSGVGHHEVVLTGLLPETNYYFRVSSKDINDQTTIDDNGGVGYTLSTPGGPVISNTSVEQTTNTTARISWTTNVAATTEIAYSVNSDMSQPILVSASSNPLTNHEINLSNLEPGTMYFFYVRSVDTNSSETTDKHVINGQAQYYSFTTTNDFTPPVISGIVVRTQPTSVDVIWTTDKPSDSQVEYGLTIAYGTSTTQDATATTKHVATILGLEPQTTYNFRIRSRGLNAVLGTSANQIMTTAQAGDATPPVISNAVIASLSLNSASVNWLTDEPATSYIDYGLSTELGQSVGSAEVASSHSVTIDGLTGGATYYFRVRSADAAGNSSVDNNGGLFYSFTTATDNTAPTISGVDDIISMNSFRVVWTTDELADSQIEYGSDSNYGSLTSLDETLVLNHSVVVQLLTPATTYHYRIRTKDVSGNLTNSSDHVVTTAAQADHAPPVITSAIAESIGRTTATITWTTDEKSTSSVLYGPNTFYAYNTSSMNDNTLHHSVQLVGLTPGIKYYFKVESVDGSGNIATEDDHGAGLTFTTVVDNTLPVISGVAVALISDTSAVVVWSTDEPTSSQVVYGTTDAYGTQTAALLTLSTVHSVTISGLTAQTKYFYKVVSADAVGNVATDDNGGVGYSFTTTDVPGRIVRSNTPSVDTTPPNISNINITAIKQSSAIVSWLTDENSYSLVKFGTDKNYGLLLGTVEESVIKHEVALVGLTAGTVYHFMVISGDVSGNKSFSNDQVFATLNNDGTSPVVPVPDTPVTTEKDKPGVSGDSLPEEKVADSQSGKLQIMSILKGLISDPNVPEVPEDFFTSTVNEIIDRVVHAPSIVGIAPKIEITGVSAKISWTTDKKANGIVAFASDGEYNATMAEPYVLFASDSDNNSIVHEVNIPNLTPATTYHFQVRSKGLIGGEARSQDATFVTASELPQITDLSISKVSDLSAVLTWKTNIPTKTDIEYKNLVSGTALTQGDPALLRDHKFTLDKLESGAPYTVVITATDENGGKTQSKAINLSTSKDGEGPVISRIKSESTLYPGKESRVQTIVSWTTDEPSTSLVYYQEGLSGDAATTEMPVDSVLTTSHTVVITKFRPATVYKIRVESTDSSGNVTKSNDVMVLTPQQKASVLDMIIKNFEQVFGWTKKI